MIQAHAPLEIHAQPFGCGGELQMIERVVGEADLAPAVHRRNGPLEETRDDSRATAGVDNPTAERVHDGYHATIASSSQAQSCDNRNCDDRMGALYRGMDEIDPEELRREMKAQKKKQVDLANLLHIDPSAASKIFSGVRAIQPREVPLIRAWLGHPAKADAVGGRGHVLPIIGQVAAGNWREAVEQPLGSIPAPDKEIPSSAFGLRVEGDSMDLVVENGGTVIVDPDDRALFPDRYYVVLNEDGDTTFKKFAADPARLLPCSTNPMHREIVIGDGTGFSIVGRVIWRASRL